MSPAFKVALAILAVVAACEAAVIAYITHLP